MAAELKKSSEDIEQWNLKLKEEIKKTTKNLELANQKLLFMSQLGTS